MLSLLLLAACNSSDVDENTPHGRIDNGDSGDGSPAPRLDVDAWVSLPYASVGDELTAGSLQIRNLGDAVQTEAIAPLVTGPFAISGDLSPLEPGEARTLTVTSTIDTDAPTVASGAIELVSGTDDVSARASAIVGTADLETAQWIKDAWGTWTVIGLPSAPFPDGHASYDDDSVMIMLPPGFADNGAMGLVTHLHGHNATLEDVVAEQYLREQLALSGRNAVYIVPQGPENAADSDFGKLDLTDGYANLVLDVQAVLYRDGLVVRPVEAPTATLTSHSGGYSAVANIIQKGGIEITAVHLFDSLYADEDVYADFVRAGGVFRSVYTSAGGTDDNNQALAGTLTGEGYAVSDSFADGDLAAGTLTIGYSSASHSGSVSEDRAYARWLAASGLPPTPGAAPELLATTIRDGVAAVRWRQDVGGARQFVVETSADGATWIASATTSESHAEVPAASFIHVHTTDPTWGDSEPSDRYGATGTDWLIVDGFDRVLGGSWDRPTHDFAAMAGAGLGVGFSCASNEAVAEGLIDLADYPHVLWLLGDESTADHTFTAAEQDAVTAYVDGGGSIVVSGSEVGWATDAGWLDDTLHASLVADDAGTLNVEGWTVGDQYIEDYPDVLAGDTVIWRWATGGAAAVGWDDRVVVVGFGVENLNEDERAAALTELREWVGG